MSVLYKIFTDRLSRLCGLRSDAVGTVAAANHGLHYLPLIEQCRTLNGVKIDRFIF